MKIIKTKAITKKRKIEDRNNKVEITKKGN
jgi:hypothetical protein